MGLDIVALREVQWHPPADDWDYHVFRSAHPNPYFADRADGLKDGLYSFTSDYSFRAGSYGGYNRWREWLSALALGVAPEKVWNDYETWVGSPFVELIDFSDCEGLIGPKTSEKLAQDFETFLAVAERDRDDYYLTTYRHFANAFGMASHDGLVQFS